MIRTLHEGLLADGVRVSLVKLCAWFGVPRRTRRTNQLIAAFQQHLDALSELPDFMDAIQMDHAEITSDDPDYLMAPAA